MQCCSLPLSLGKVDTKEGEGQLQSSGARTTAEWVVGLSFVRLEEEKAQGAVAEASRLTKDKPNAKLWDLMNGYGRKGCTL